MAHGRVIIVETGEGSPVLFAIGGEGGAMFGDAQFLYRAWLSSCLLVTSDGASQTMDIRLDSIFADGNATFSVLLITR